MGSVLCIVEAVHADHKHVGIVPAFSKTRKLVHNNRLIVLRGYTGGVIVLPAAYTGISVITHTERNIIKNSPGIAYFVRPILRMSLAPFAGGINNIVVRLVIV